MYRSYEIVSPSLEGVLKHEAITYENVRRPAELLRILDGPASKTTALSSPGKIDQTAEERKMLEEYFHDLYGVFMKKLSFFAVESGYAPNESLKLQAMLQEIIKVKRLMQG